jgi:hypothetical protein
MCTPLRHTDNLDLHMHHLSKCRLSGNSIRIPFTGVEAGSPEASQSWRSQELLIRSECSINIKGM